MTVDANCLTNLPCTANSYISVLLGNGDGTFRPRVDYLTGGTGAWTLASGDFNGDGKIDIAVANTNCPTTPYCADIGTVAILLGNGDGTFQPATQYLVAMSPRGIAVGDFNRDGKLDLAVANRGTGGQVEKTVSILLGNGDGTFQPQVKYTVGDNPAFIASGDFNGDGVLDLAVANNGDATVSVLLGNGDGTFRTQVVYSVGAHPSSVIAVDVNHDGNLDLIAACAVSDNVEVLLGKGDGTFGSATGFTTAASSFTVTAADFNGDGNLDLAVTIPSSNEFSISLGNGAGAFAAPVFTAAGQFDLFLIAADFNGDGIPDLAVTSEDGNTVSVYLGTHGQAAAPTLSPVPGTYSSIQTVSLSDSTPGATIYYTTNGTTPTTSSATYNGPITASATTTIEAIAIAPDYLTSAVATGAYTIILPPAASPVFSPAAGTYSSAQMVSLSDSAAGATIYYTTNGTTPTTSSASYAGPIPVSSSTTTIEAIAVATGYATSPVATGAYNIALTLAPPVFSPTPGTYSSAQMVSLSDSTAGAIIHYTTNGTTPTASSASYTGPIAVSATTTIEAIAVAPGYTTSALATGTYSFVLPAAASPALSPAPATYPSAQTVGLLDSTAGATIYYTTNGTTPTPSSASYSAPIAVSATTTIQAIAIAPGYATSAGTTGTYIISPNSGSVSLTAPNIFQASQAIGQGSSLTLTSSASSTPIQTLVIDPPAYPTEAGQLTLADNGTILSTDPGSGAHIVRADGDLELSRNAQFYTSGGNEQWSYDVANTPANLIEIGRNGIGLYTSPGAASVSSPVAWEQMMTAGDTGSGQQVSFVAPVGFTSLAPTIFSANMSVGNGATLTIGSNAFKVNGAGNVIRLNGATTNFPSANAPGALTNDGAGNFSYVAPPAVNLAASGVGGVVGNLPVSHLNGGASASVNTFWRGDGTWATPSGGGSGAMTVGTIATLPGIPATGQLARVSDGTSVSDCTTGGGSTAHWCAYNGSAWVFYSMSSAAYPDITAATIAASTTTYNAPPFYTPSVTETLRTIPMPQACQAANLYVITSTPQPSTGSLVLTVKNLTTSASGPTITVAASAAAGIFSDTTHTVNFAAGNQLTVQYVNNATSLSAQIISFSFSCLY